VTYLITATKVGYFFYFTHNLSNKRKKEKTFPCTKLSQHENSKCSRSRKHNCDVVSKWRHSVGSSSSYPCQSRYDVGTGLRIMSNG